MADKLLFVATGIVGAALGAVGGWFAARHYYKTKYEKWANEEIESVQNEYKKPYEELEAAQVISEPEEPLNNNIEQRARELLAEYSRKVRDKVAMPKVITRDEFDDLDGYEYDKISLWWYADSVLATDDDELIEEEDYEGLVGYDFEDEFRKDGVDDVYVQNDDRKEAYEISRSLKYYYTDIMPDANKRRRRANDDRDGA